MQKLFGTSVVLRVSSTLTLALVLAVQLSGCGQKGPLALQPDAASPASAAASAAQR